MAYCTTNPDSDTALFRQAQMGDAASLDALMARHDGLVHHLLRQQGSGALTYDEVLQEGRIGLWQAILHFDPTRGVAFASYAAVAIIRHIWRAVQRDRRTAGIPGGSPPRTAGEPYSELELHEVRAVLHALVETLPVPQRRVVRAYYGLDGQGGRSTGELGRWWGCSRQAIYYHLRRARAHLRHPAFSAALRALLDRNRRADYLAALRPRRRP
jgi:RNA polymerase sigma factor (sigma-70 family)